MMDLNRLLALTALVPDEIKQVCKQKMFDAAMEVPAVKAFMTSKEYRRELGRRAADRLPPEVIDALAVEFEKSRFSKLR